MEARGRGSIPGSRHPEDEDLQGRQLAAIIAIQRSLNDPEPTRSVYISA